MPKIKPPTAIKSAPKIDAKFTLDVIEDKIAAFVKFVKSGCSGQSPAEKSARNNAKFLQRDLKELQKEDSLPSRSTAVVKLYDNFNEWVAQLPEEVDEKEGLKNGDNPKSVKLAGATKCPKGCDADYHSTLIAALKKSKSYTYTKNNNSWTPDLGKQTGHADGKGWKAYVDAEEGAGTKWRMGFSMAYDEIDEELTVDIDYCKIGH